MTRRTSGSGTRGRGRRRGGKIGKEAEEGRRRRTLRRRTKLETDHLGLVAQVEGRGRERRRLLREPIGAFSSSILAVDALSSQHSTSADVYHLPLLASDLDNRSLPPSTTSPPHLLPLPHPPRPLQARRITSTQSTPYRRLSRSHHQDAIPRFRQHRGEWRNRRRIS